jgi:dihydroxy-acid dehydratase
MIGHVAPEAAVGGPIALIRDGDVISLDIPNRRIDVQVPEEELKRRREVWQPPAPKYTSGALAKYAKLVSSASEGAVCG